MAGTSTHDVQIIASSLDDIKAVLGHAEGLRTGGEVPLADGVSLKVEEVSKASGFDVATILLTGVVTLVTSTTSALLIEWLKSRLLAGDKKRTITIIIDGQKVELHEGG